MKKRKMRKWLVIGIVLILVAVVFAAVPMNVSAEGTVPEGMVSYWRFDEGTGTTAGDSADGNDGSLVPLPPEPPTWTSGLVGGALDFDGVDDYVRILDDASLRLNSALTVEAWVKIETLPDSPGLHVVDKHHGYGGYTLVFDNINGVSLNIYTNTHGRVRANVAANIVGDGQWHHLAGTWDGSYSTAYIDGEAGSSVVVSGIILFPGSFDLTIGDHNQLSVRRRVDGLIDEVAIHNRALSSTEIEEHWNNGVGIEITPDANTIGLWHFDEGTGTTATDFSNNNNDGTLLPSVSGPSWTTGLVGGALNFDGVDDYIRIENEEPFDFGNGPFSITTWIKTSGKRSFNEHILSKGVAWGGYDDYVLFVHRNYGNVKFQYSMYSSNDLIGTTRVDDNEWHFVAISQSGIGTDCIKLYVDGVLEDTKDGEILTNGNVPLFIGVNFGTSNPTKPYSFNGLIDEVAIWNKALTSDEILQHYNNGLSGQGYCYVPPEDVVQDVIEDIDEIVVPSGSEDEVNNAIDELENATESFENGEIEEGICDLGKAVEDLTKAQDDGADTGEVIEGIADFASELVDSVIDDFAADPNADPKDIIKAQELNDEALQSMDQGDYETALKDLEKAYKKATKA